MELSHQESRNSMSRLLYSLHTLCLALLTLLLPLSFLLLARLTSPSPQLAASSSTVISIALQATPPLLYCLVAFASLAALLCMLTGHILIPPTYISWAFLCLFQACISLGIESTTTGDTMPPSSSRASNIGRIVFIVGLYETMLVWGRMFVRPVVDDTIFGAAMVKKGSVDRMVMGVAFSVLWMLVMRNEVEPLVMAAGEEVLMDGMKWGGLVRRLVSYATIVTGSVRVVELAVWVVKLFLLPCREEDEDFAGCAAPGDDKV